MNPFRNILQLSVGDFLAKTLNFLAFVYLARVLGVANYGGLEFSRSVIVYFLLLADGGLELWATREAAQGKDLRQLATQIVSLRMVLAAAAFGVLLTLLPLFPDSGAVQKIIVLLGLTLFTQAIGLKWVFMGREHMGRVAAGLLVAQIVFAIAVFASVRSPAEVLWVPVLQLAGDLAMSMYFLWLFAKAYGRLRFTLTLQGLGNILRPALPLGAAHGLALMSFNFDSVLLGFFLGPMAVGWYNAAYKPVTVVLAMPVTYFLGLFPVLSRTYAGDHEAFRGIVVRSLRLTSIVAMPIGVGGTFLAWPIITLLFGPAYANAVPALQILSWSAVLVILRGTYRQAFNAAGRPQLDLRCAGVATALNLGLNLLLIPRYGLIGAAVATLVAESIWLTMASYYFHGYVTAVNLLPFLWRPATAAIAMASCMLLAQPLFWPVQALFGLFVYLGVLLLVHRIQVPAPAERRKLKAS